MGKTACCSPMMCNALIASTLCSMLIVNKNTLRPRVYLLVKFKKVNLKSRPVLHHCVVIFFWSSGIMDCTCMLLTFENGVLLMRYGASVVWHHSLLLMNSFNKTEAAVFSCRLCFLRAFPFISLVLDIHKHGKI